MSANSEGGDGPHSPPLPPSPPISNGGGVMVTSFNEVGETSTTTSSSTTPAVTPPAKISQAVIIKCAKISTSSGGAEDGAATVPVPGSARSPVDRYLRAPQPGKSMLPKPEISPKPAHLRPPGSNGSSHLMTGSLHLTPTATSAGPTDIDAFAASVASSGGARPNYATSPPGGSGGKQRQEEEGAVATTTPTQAPTTKTLTEKTKGTASILKSTLKRMTKLSLRTSSSSSSSHHHHHSQSSSSPPDNYASQDSHHHHSPVRRSMSPFRNGKKNSPNGHHHHHQSPETNGGGGGSLLRPKSSSLRKNNSNSDILSSSNSNSLKKNGGGSVSQNSLNRSASTGNSRHRLVKGQAISASDAANFKVPSSSDSGVRSLSRSSSASSTNNMGRSHSLKRAGRNKDNAAAAQHQNSSLQRTGSGSGLNRHDVKRSNSMHQSYHGGGGGGGGGGSGSTNGHHGSRRFRDRDLNVKLSRGIQTSLTKDAMTEDQDDAEDRVVTDVAFSLYMPDLLGGDTGGNDIETHVTEPTEPVDVRRNRQLTLDNMKLHREIEKLKSAANESDHLKRELRSVRSRLEEEQRARQRIESELDQHNEKVKLIARSMDSVEQEFEVRDANIRRLEGQVSKSKSAMATLEDKLAVANDVIASQNADLAEAVAAQKAAVREYEVAETEANELHEFLQAEKFTLAEALREAEAEIDSLKSKVATSEEQCGHLVRLGEQRHQEILSLETQLKAMEDKAKEMLLAQGAEISRSTILIAELSWKIEDAFKANFPTAFEALDGGGGAAAPPPPLPASSPPTSKRQLNGHLPESLQPDQQTEDAEGDSLLNLSNAIQRRVSVEKRVSETLTTVSKESQPTSLIDRIAQVDQLVDFFVEASSSSAKQATNEGDQNGHATITANGGTENGVKNTHRSDQKENISLNGNSGGSDPSSSSLGNDSTKKKYDEEIAEMKAKYLKHRQILVSNREMAEREVMRLDDIYHETVSEVLKTLSAIPEVVKSHKELACLQGKLQTALLENESGSVNGGASNGGSSKMKLNGLISQQTPPTSSSEQGL